MFLNPERYSANYLRVSDSSWCEYAKLNAHVTPPFLIKVRQKMCHYGSSTGPCETCAITLVLYRGIKAKSCHWCMILRTRLYSKSSALTILSLPTEAAAATAVWNHLTPGSETWSPSSWCLLQLPSSSSAFFSVKFCIVEWPILFFLCWCFISFLCLLWKLHTL